MQRSFSFTVTFLPLFPSPLTLIPPSPSQDEIQENNSIVRYMAEQACWTFAPGFATDIPALRLNLDPVFATQRPLLFYFVTSGIHIGTHAALWLLGFRLCTQPGNR